MAVACPRLDLDVHRGTPDLYEAPEDRDLVTDEDGAVEGHALHALKILRQPGEWNHLGANARRTIEAKYDIGRTLPQFKRLLGRATGKVAS